jgi:hypothetical protein
LVKPLAQGFCNRAQVSGRLLTDSDGAEKSRSPARNASSACRWPSWQPRCCPSGRSGRPYRNGGVSLCGGHCLLRVLCGGILVFGVLQRLHDFGWQGARHHLSPKKRVVISGPRRESNPLTSAITADSQHGYGTDRRTQEVELTRPHLSSSGDQIHRSILCPVCPVVAARLAVSGTGSITAGGEPISPLQVLAVRSQPGPLPRRLCKQGRVYVEVANPTVDYPAASRASHEIPL